MSIREKIAPEELDYYDNIAQIVASLYEENATMEQLGKEVPELQRAVYTLGQAYMMLYKKLLENSIDGQEGENEE